MAVLLCGAQFHNAQTRALREPRASAINLLAGQEVGRVQLRGRHCVLLATSLAVVASVTIGAYVLTARDDSSTAPRAAPLRAASPAEATTATDATAAPTSVRRFSGPTQEVVVDGLEPGTPVHVVQCANRDHNGATCTYGTGEPWLADASGTVTAAAPVTEWIFSTIGWTHCASKPCVLGIGVGSSLDLSFVPVTYRFEPPTPQPDPQLELTSPATAAGAKISFTITGLPADDTYEVFVCARAEAGPVPVGSDSSTTCVGSRNSIALRTDRRGTVSMTGFMLPALDCGEADRCWIGS